MVRKIAIAGHGDGMAKPLHGECLHRLATQAASHDLGKRRVPDAILDKPAKLNADGRLVMHAHRFETTQVRKNIQGCEDIRRWAANHHEGPGDRGYPYGREAPSTAMFRPQQQSD